MSKATTFYVIFGLILITTTIIASNESADEYEFNQYLENEYEYEYEYKNENNEQDMKLRVPTSTTSPTSSSTTRSLTTGSSTTGRSITTGSTSSTSSTTGSRASTTGAPTSVPASEVLSAPTNRSQVGFTKSNEFKAMNGLRFAISNLHDAVFKTMRGDSQTLIVEYQTLLPGTSYPIFGSMISIISSLTSDKWVFNDYSLNITSPVDLTITLSYQDAANICVLQLPAYERKRSVMNPEVELYILPSIYNNNKFIKRVNFDGIGTLAYRCYLNNWIYFIDAKTSLVKFNISNNQTAFAATYYNGNRNISTLAHGGTNYMEDVSRTVTVVDCANTDCSGTIYKQVDADDSWTGSQQQIAAQVQWGVSKVLDYFSTVHGRSGLDGAGGPASILSEDGVTLLLANKIHYGSNENFAAWTGYDFIYGDGDGVNFGPMVSLDIIAHELSHAIVEYECNLDYTYESGALRESFGDITAAVVSYWIWGENDGTWKFGEDVYTPGTPGDALRYLNEPSLADSKGFTANDDPDHVSEMYNGTTDNGGVHVNCGIPNKAFYLLAKGGNHSNGGVVMTGIGIEAAYAIWYRAVTVYFLSNTDFLGARSATLYACADLYGQTFNYQSVQTAWGLCGVGSVPNPNPTNYISNGGFESESSPWTLSGSGAVYVRNGAEKKAGFGYVKLGLSNSYTGSVTQGFSIPNNAVKANLTFWMWCTSSDSTTVIKDRLYLEIKNATNGVLLDQLDIFDNTDASAAYVQYAYNLLAYVNVPGLRLDFRVVNDGNAPTTFRVDEVYLNVVYYKK